MFLKLRSSGHCHFPHYRSFNLSTAAFPILAEFKETLLVAKLLLSISARFKVITIRLVNSPKRAMATNCSINVTEEFFL
jgi:hypothetical protein